MVAILNHDIISLPPCKNEDMSMLKFELYRYEKWLFGLIIAGGFAARLIVSKPWSPGPAYTSHLIGKQDQCWYSGFQLIMDLLWHWTGGRASYLVLIQVAVFSILLIPIKSIAADLGLSANRRIFAFAAVVFLPYYVATSANQPQVAWSIGLATLSIWSILRWRRNKYSWNDGLLFLVIAVVTCLFRPSILPALLGALLTMILFCRECRRRTVLLAAAMYFSLFLIHQLSVPMQSLNPSGNPSWASYCVKTLTPFPYLTGYNLYLSNSPYTFDFVKQHSNGSFEGYIWERLPMPEHIADPYDREGNAILTKHAIKWISENPGDAVLGIFAKLYKFLEPVLPDSASRRLSDNLLYTLPYIFYFGFFVRRMFDFSPARNINQTILLGALFGFLLPHLLIFGLVRMRMTFEFAIILIAATYKNEKVRAARP
jgi:hypothetical protein